MTTLSEPVARPRVAQSRKRTRIDQIIEPAIASPSRSSSWSGPDLSGVAILDAMRHGVMVISSDFQVIYRNLKAREIYDVFGCVTTTLPDQVTEACRRFMALCLPRDLESDLESDPEGDRPCDVSCDPFVMECYPAKGRKFNLQITWMESSPQAGWMLVTIEDCYADMMVLWRREQARHGFTEREIQIWTLLHLECTYQEIAAQLAITVNTVKTHVKNLNAKRRHHPQSSRLWFFPGG
jgi:DNA-binding CsgD family transcriptional regulator